MVFLTVQLALVDLIWYVFDFVFALQLAMLICLTVFPNSGSESVISLIIVRVLNGPCHADLCNFEGWIC